MNLSNHLGRDSEMLFPSHDNSLFQPNQSFSRPTKSTFNTAERSMDSKSSVMSVSNESFDWKEKMDCSSPISDSSLSNTLKCKQNSMDIVDSVCLSGQEVDTIDFFKTRNAKRSREEMLETTVPDIEIQESRLKRIKLPSNRINLVIRTLSGAKLPLEIDADDLILQLKAEIEMHLGIPASQQRLIFGGIALNDYKTIHSSRLIDGSVVHMVVSLQGGNDHQS